MSESPIFVRVYDLLLWLIPAVEKFPRAQRPVLGRAVQEAALGLQAHLTSAALGDDPPGDLRRADVDLALLRARLRLCYDMRLITIGQYRHVSEQVAEVGRLLGGWRRQLQRTAAP
ncbi:MAG TPA: diversity-generating retroelement protein Avd [Roseiflexaceae bacterium]|nr:diversity-generating retroelement protein Avd [Roseiflexaceae bacterium]